MPTPNGFGFGLGLGVSIGLTLNMIYQRFGVEKVITPPPNEARPETGEVLESNTVPNPPIRGRDTGSSVSMGGRESRVSSDGSEGVDFFDPQGIDDRGSGHSPDNGRRPDNVHTHTYRQDDMQSHIGELPTKPRPSPVISTSQRKGNNSNSTSRTPRPLSNSESRGGKSNVDIGLIFGLDVGGTLSKLIYFQRSAPRSAVPPSPSTPSGKSSQVTQSPPPDPLDPRERKARYSLGAKSVSSVGETFSDVHGNATRTASASLTSSAGGSFGELPAHQAALDHFYTFAGNQETFGISGRKDSSLSFHCRALGGVLHFLRFETKHMDGALELMKQEGLDKSIHSMGCTGGGAHKYESLWSEQVGIDMVKHGEMETMVKGIEVRKLRKG